MIHSATSISDRWFLSSVDFNPNSIIYDARHRSQVLKSDLGIGITLAALTFLGYKTDFMTVAKYYVLPYFNINVRAIKLTLKASMTVC
jgi:omega-6 fatty acid desaturase (delta-12 desaturase)